MMLRIFRIEELWPTIPGHDWRQKLTRHVKKMSCYFFQDCSYDKSFVHWSDVVVDFDVVVVVVVVDVVVGVDVVVDFDIAVVVLFGNVNSVLTKDFNPWS